jgi:poly(A) polymerase
MKFKDVLQMKPATLKRFARLNRFDEHLELHRMDCLSSHRMLDNYEFVRRFMDETPAGEIHPPRLVTGDDLLTMGLSPGPVFKEILEAVEEAQLNDSIRTREEALILAKSLIPAEN